VGAFFLLPVLGSSHQRQLRPADVAARLQRLLTDVDESVRKSSEDVEVVFSSLETEDQHLEASLSKEIAALNKTHVKLMALHSKVQSKANASATELSRLDASMHASTKAAGKYNGKLTRSTAEQEKVLKSVHQLMAIIRDAEAARQKEVPSESLGDMRHLLQQHGDLRPHFSDVFVIFQPREGVQVTMQQALPQPMFGRAVSLLQEIGGRVQRKRRGSFLQVQSRQQSLAAQTSQLGAKADAIRSARVDGERKSEELAFSTAFAEAAMNADEEFLEKVQGHIKAKAEFVQAVRDARRKQIATLTDLGDLLKGQFDAPAPSFLQTSKPKKQGVVNLQTEIESTLRNHGDTHAILMRIKAQLDQNTPIDANSVSNVVKKMGTALHSIDKEQAAGEEARQRCEGQHGKDRQSEQRLKGSIKLMTASENHTSLAIQATNKNMESIEAKSHALNDTVSTFQRLSSQAERTFGSKTHDRETILAAVQKAKLLAPKAVAKDQTQATVAFFSQLVALFVFEDAKEKAYKAQHASMKQDLLEYTQLYEQLLADRRVHYGATLSSLNEYAAELAEDKRARAGNLGEDGELQAEGQDLCDTILNFFKRHEERRMSASNALRAALPKLPEILGSEDVESTDDVDESTDDVDES